MRLIRLLIGISLLIFLMAALPDVAQAGLVPAPAHQGGDLPDFLRPLAAWGFALQRQMNGQIREHLAAMQDGVKLEPALALIFAAFVYGVLHALGPGHGKLVIGTWFTTRHTRISRALAACGLAAMVQGASAVLVVVILSSLLSLAPRDVMSHAAWVEVAAYGLIILMGLYLGWQSLRGQSSCGHAHHHCCGHGHGHGHSHDHHHDHGREMENGLFATAALVGFRPCSGAILILLFTFANHLAWLGIAAVFAMALGVGLTMSGIGLSALGLNRLLERGQSALPRLAGMQTILGLLGAATITVLGLVLLLGALQGGGPALSG